MSNAVDTPVEWIGTGLFVACWIMAIVTWIYSVAEFRWLCRLDPRAFGRGPVILRFTDTTWPVRALDPLLAPVETPSGSLVPLSSNRMGFAPRGGSLFNPFTSFKNVLLFTGVISCEHGYAQVAIRAPLGISAFIGVWLVMWITFALFLGPTTDCHINGRPYPPGSPECLSIGVVPPIVVIALLGIVAFAARKRARSLFEEIKAHAAQPPIAA